jgi:hypothetical protein
MLYLVCYACTWWCFWLGLLLIIWCMLWAKFVFKLWPWLNTTETWNLFIAGIGTSMCRICWDPRCYHLYARLLRLMLWVTCLDNLEIFVQKLEKQAKCWEKIKMGLYCPTSSRWLSIAHLDELEPCSGCRNHCLKLLIIDDIGLAWC